MTEIVCESIVVEVFSICPERGAGRRVDVTECGVVDLERDQAAIQAFLDVGEANVLFKSNCCAASRVVDVTHHVIPWQGKLFIFNLLHTKDVQVHSPCECAKGIKFSRVGDGVNVDGSNIVACEVGHI